MENVFLCLHVVYQPVAGTVVAERMSKFVADGFVGRGPRGRAVLQERIRPHKGRDDRVGTKLSFYH